MQIPASISRPSARRLLTLLPLGLLGLSLASDLMYLGGAEAELWTRLALYSMVGGFIAIVAALTVPGFVVHINITVMVAVLYATNIWLRLGDPKPAMAIALSLIGAGILAAASRLDEA